MEILSSKLPLPVKSLTFTRQLENALKEKGLSDVVVMNAGVQGYGPDQELRRMQRERGEARPDLIVWCLFSGNDYGDLLRNRMARIGTALAKAGSRRGDS